MLEEFGERIRRDEELPGKPVVSVDLSSTTVTDADLKDLTPLTQLQWLDLGETQVTDEGLKHLDALTQLHSLNLRDTQVTDEGLKHLAALTQLQWVGLMWTKVTDAGLKNLIAALPMWSSWPRKRRGLPDGHGVPEAKPMQTILRRLLDRLDAIAEQDDEFGGGNIFAAVGMTNAVFDGFLRPVPDFALPVQYCMQAR